VKKKYPLHQTVEIEGQKIHFNKVIIYPTRVALEIKYDITNSKKIFDFDDLRLVDEKGEEYATSRDGSIRMDDYTEILYLESNYFKHPKELYLKASRLKALDKDKLEVIVDLQKEELLKKPDDRLSLEEINKTPEQIEFVFSIKKELPDDEKYAYNILKGQYTDSLGKSYDIDTFASSTGDKEYGRNYIHIDNIDYANPITFTIVQYPTRIYGDINIKVK